MKTFLVLYCLLCASWTEGARINAEGFERGEVSFKCSHSLAWRNDKYFCKDPCKRSNDILLSVKSGKKTGVGRITLEDKGNGDYVVTLSELQLTDSGKYWCGVERLGYDTYTEIHLTVKRAPFNETTVTAGTFPTWTHHNISNSTQQTSGVDTTILTNISTALNYTEGGEQSSNSGILLSVVITILAVIILISLVLAALCRKQKRVKAQLQAVSTSSLISAQKREVGYKLDKICKETESIKKISESGSLTLKPSEDEPKAAYKAAECSDSHHIYDNACCTKEAADRHSTANLQDEDDISSGIYVNHLPNAESLSCGVGSSKTDINKKAEAGLNGTNYPPERCSENTSACDSTSGHESTEERPRSLWFGLDLSDVV